MFLHRTAAAAAGIANHRKFFTGQNTMKKKPALFYIFCTKRIAKRQEPLCELSQVFNDLRPLCLQLHHASHQPNTRNSYYKRNISKHWNDVKFAKRSAECCSFLWELSEQKMQFLKSASVIHSIKKSLGCSTCSVRQAFLKRCSFFFSNQLKRIWLLLTAMHNTNRFCCTGTASQHCRLCTGTASQHCRLCTVSANWAGWAKNRKPKLYWFRSALSRQVNHERLCHTVTEA